MNTPLLLCHEPQAPVEPILILYCVLQPFGAAVVLTVMLFAVGVPLTVRCAGGLGAVHIVSLSGLGLECKWVLALFAVNLARAW